MKGQMGLNRNVSINLSAVQILRPKDGAAGRIEGAQKIGNMWVLPKDAPKPDDGRKRPKK